jgi:hypothetical protein
MILILSPPLREEDHEVAEGVHVSSLRTAKAAALK